MERPYNIEDKNSIIEFAKKFIGKSIQSEFGIQLNDLILSNKDKGQLGKVIEKLYFKYEPNSNAKADFEKAGLELKSSGLKQLIKSKEYRAKERISLNIIDYVETVKENFETDFLQGKNAHLLIIFYFYVKGLNQLSSEIKLVGDWMYPIADIEVIKKDWIKIQQKIRDGKAHELSEGDTLYLGASTKGADANSTRKQPFSEIPAKQRAYSLKQGYVNHIIASIANEPTGIYGKLITPETLAKNLTIEDIVISKFKPYYGKTVDQIINLTGVQLNIKAKSFYASLTKAILGIELNKEIEEFEKADIKVKTIRLKENNLPKEDISFANFKYEEIINENWEDTDFKEILEHKFLFVFFQFKEDKLILRKVKFWNMPYVDLLEAEKVWNKTKEIVSNGEIVKEIKTDKKGNDSRKTNFPGKKFNKVSHVRPHASNAEDTYPLPIEDILTKSKEYTKHCFWLNNTYVRDEIYLK